LENATEVMPQMMLSWEYRLSSWSALRSNSLQVASSEPVQKAFPLGKNYGEREGDREEEDQSDQISKRHYWAFRT
jgi:hypothetical protein